MGSTMKTLENNNKNKYWKEKHLLKEWWKTLRSYPKNKTAVFYAWDWNWVDFFGKCSRQIHIKVLKKVEIINLKIYKFLKAYIKMGKIMKFSPT